MGGLGALGLLTFWVFVLEIECNKTMIQTIMVRKVLEDIVSWLESSVNHPIDYSFLKIIEKPSFSKALLKLKP